ncbi:CPBP family intramembrane metalloprotease [Candidatus Bathyarchaeota archaeon]|nr:MAG: CPBP family intramembrane metalloprotease [Candidatus Bathyarchaeota archaeon]
MSPTSRAVLGWISTIAAFFVFLTYIVAMGMASALVTSTQLASDLMSSSGRPALGAFYIYSRDTAFHVPVSLWLLTSVCILIFATCFAAGLRSRDEFFSSLKKLSKAGRITSSSNWLVAMPLISCGLYVVVLIVTSILELGGIPPGSLCDPTINQCPTQARLFAGLAYAPVGEELAYRIITPLGLVIPIRIFWRRLITNQGPSTSKFLSITGLSLLSPERAKRKTGYPTFATNGWRGIHWLEWIFIVISSVLFGLAHIESGGGTNWGVGKVVTAAISGFVIAIVFVAYGAYAAILLHWFFDFYFEISLVGGSTFGGPFSLLPFLFVLTSLIVGALSLLVAIGWVVRRITPRPSPTTYKTPEPEALPIQA